MFPGLTRQQPSSGLDAARCVSAATEAVCIRRCFVTAHGREDGLTSSVARVASLTVRSPVVALVGSSQLSSVKIEIGNSLNGTFSGSIDESALESPEPPPNGRWCAFENFLFELPAKTASEKVKQKE